MNSHSARHLIIGGGIIGCSIAYHLARMGERDVVLLEKSTLTDGATWHAAGLVGQLRSSRNTTRMLQKSVALYDRIEAETGLATDWKKVGSLRLAASKDRLLEARRLTAMARSFGLEMHLISPAEAKALFPYIETTGLEGAAFIPGDGHVDPAGLCQAIAAGARKFGATLKQNVKVTDLEEHRGRITRVITSEGDWRADEIVLAAGMWSREISNKLGFSLPACALEHQYIVTEPIRGFPEDLPTLRDPDRLIYYKPDAGGRLVIGGYENNTVPFGEDGIAGEFARQLLPENLDRFAPLAENAAALTPIVNEVGVRTVINGPIPYSSDGDFVLGRPPGFDNLMVAAGFLYGIAAAGGAGEMIAQWIVDGAPELDLWPLDIRRFSPHHSAKSYMYPRAVEHYAHHYKLRYPGAQSEAARGLRRSPLYDILKNHGAVYGSKNGWERPLWFAPEGVEAVDQLDYMEPGWWPYAAREHHAVRNRVALIDQTSFAKFELVGEGARDALQSMAVSNMDRPPGTVIYTQLCNKRGGIEADLTITRLADKHYYIVTGAGFGVHDGDWIRRQIPEDAPCRLTDITSARAVINICGPLARTVLQKCCEEDISNEAFPYATAREITIGAARLLAVRIGYVGELGWEMHIPTEFTAHVYETLWRAGRNEGIANAGYRAIDSLRLEKGYLYWSADITPDYTPIEAGLGFRVHLKSKGAFTGRNILEKQKSDNQARRLCIFTSEEKLPLFGGEPIMLNRTCVSLATSAGYGHTVEKTILFGYLSADIADETEFEVEAFAHRHKVLKVSGPLYDPQNTRLKC